MKLNEIKVNAIEINKMKKLDTSVKAQSMLARGQALDVDPRLGIGRWPAVRHLASAHGQALGVGPRSGIGHWCLVVPS